MDGVQEKQEREHGKLKVLVAEDEPLIKEVITKILQMSGHNVTTFESGEEALEQARKDGQFDWVITDYGLKGELKGTDLVAKMREEKLGDPFVTMVTGNMNVVKERFTTEQLEQLGIHSIRQKPFGVADLQQEATKARQFKLQQESSKQN